MRSPSLRRRGPGKSIVLREKHKTSGIVGGCISSRESALIMGSCAKTWHKLPRNVQKRQKSTQLGRMSRP